MRKRTFLKMLSAGVATSGFSSAAPKDSVKLQNWAGNLSYSAKRFEEALTLGQLPAVLASADHWKVLGSRHCFNTIADTRENLLSLNASADAIDIDAKARTVAVDAALKYGQLCPVIHRKGFALHNLASLPHISIAGACSTATHGSGEKNGNLASSVVALEMITAGGDKLRLSRESNAEMFYGAVVGLGALGVITRVTLKIEPAFQVRQYVYQNLPIRQMADHFDAIQGSAYSVSLFTDWRNRNVNEVWIKDRVGPNTPFAAPSEFYGSKLAKRNLHPIAELSAENCTEQMGVPGPWYDRLPHFKMGFTPSAGKELQSEYFVPRRNAVEAILAIERLHEQVSPHLLISEIRTIAADELWLSTAYNQPSVAIHFTWKQDWPAVQKLLPLIEKQLSPFNVRPHWGKLFSIAPQDLRSRYSKMKDFVQLASKLDPKGKFRNEFLNRLVFDS